MAAEETRKPRRQTPFVLGLLLILAILPVGWFAYLREPPPPPPVVLAPPAPVVPEEKPRPVDLELSEVKGTVEVRHGGTGPWVPAKPGAALRASDAVRTHDGSYAVLIGGEAVEVRMDPGTEVSVDELTDSLSRILLGNGMATATVRPGKRHTFEVKAAGTDAVARTGAGTFSMSNDGKGTVAVGTREGEVALLGQGKVVIVRAGQQSIVRAGTAPSEPTPLPSSLLLKVQWPGEPSTRQRKLVVTGEASPGSRLEVAGEVFSPDAEGRFTHTIPLREGRNTVRVSASSVGGVKQEDTREIVLDTTPPKAELDPEIWK
ncbi:FecR domain-containing protein [Myxococcaceae bacterium GXIMD 01537]